MANDTLTITDNRTGNSYELPVHYGTYPEYGAAINALELRQIKVSEDDFGLLTYDPVPSPPVITYVTKSQMTYVFSHLVDDPDLAVAVEQLAVKSISDENGIRFDLAYDGNTDRLISLDDTRGSSFAFEYLGDLLQVVRDQI